MIYKNVFKPLLDFLTALIALCIFSPVCVILIIVLLINNRGNVFFFQKRPGKNEKIFRVIKFKTMNDKKDKSGNLLSDDKRLTKLGKIIRKTSLDELPQLINVIKGDMSLVGPRPLLPEYLPLYSEEQKKRHLVKPGITGWAQVNGRNAITWQKKFELDVWYVHNISFLLDLKIFFKTIVNVIGSKNIEMSDEATTNFLGN